MIKIPVVRDIGTDFRKSIRELLRVWVEIEKYKDEVVVVDMSDCRFSGCTFLLGLHLLYRKYLQNGFRLSLNTKCTNERFSSYLSLTNFNDGFHASSLESGRADQLYQLYSSKSYLPLLYFPANKLAEDSRIRERVLDFLSQSIRTRLNLTASINSAVTYLIDEAVNNITDHAATSTGYVFTQFYPRLDFMDIAIADMGVSILGSYQATERTEVLSHAQALEFALNGESTKAEGHRGFGIRTSRRMLVEGLKGRYFIMSGDAFMYNEPGNPETIEVFPPALGISWNGTYLGLRVPVSQRGGFSIAKYLE